MTGPGRPIEGERFESRLTAEMIDWLVAQDAEAFPGQRPNASRQLREVLAKAMVDSET